MGPKEQKGKKGGKGTEVERTFLEFQIEQCNREKARLKSAVNEYEKRNEELQNAYDKLDEDGGDTITYLKKNLQAKINENIELKGNVKGLEEIREIENAQFKQTVAELEKQFILMKGQLMAENKILSSQMNTMDEFKAIKDDLMLKFENNEQKLKEQELYYKRIIYEMEKKFVLDKDKLKREMERRVLQLAQDYQDATELRIAATTHRVMRENIAINNEFESILTSQSSLRKQNQKSRSSERNAIIAKELAEDEKKYVINKNIVQQQVINQLTNTLNDLQNKKALYEKKHVNFEELRRQVETLTKTNENLSLKVRILEQSAYALTASRHKDTVSSLLLKKENEKLNSVMKDAAVIVKAMLKIDQLANEDPRRRNNDTKMMLCQLLDVIYKYNEKEKTESMETFTSLGVLYEAGDLGLISKFSKAALDKQRIVSESSSDLSKSEIQDKSSLFVTGIPTSLRLKSMPSMKILAEGSKEGVKSSTPSLDQSIISSVSSNKDIDENMLSNETIQEKREADKSHILLEVLKDSQASQLSIRPQTSIKIERDSITKSKIDIENDNKNEEK